MRDRRIYFVHTTSHPAVNHATAAIRHGSRGDSLDHNSNDPYECELGERNDLIIGEFLKIERLATSMSLGAAEILFILILLLCLLGGMPLATIGVVFLFLFLTAMVVR
jgi:hypothetical protein